MIISHCTTAIVHYLAITVHDTISIPPSNSHHIKQSNSKWINIFLLLNTLFYLASLTLWLALFIIYLVSLTLWLALFIIYLASLTLWLALFILILPH